MKKGGREMNALGRIGLALLYLISVGLSSFCLWILSDAPEQNKLAGIVVLSIFFAAVFFAFTRCGKPRERIFSEEPPEYGCYRILALFPNLYLGSFFELIVQKARDIDSDDKDNLRIRHLHLSSEFFCSPPAEPIFANENKWLSVVEGGHLKIIDKTGAEVLSSHHEAPKPKNVSQPAEEEIEETSPVEPVSTE